MAHAQWQPTTGDVWVWYLNGATFAGAAQISPSTVWKVRGVGDFNADGKPDIMWQHPTTGELSTWLLNGTSIINGVQINGSSPWTAIGAK